MKLYSKEALILGGLYGVLDTPFALLGLERISNILFIIFIISLIMLLCNKTPKFITHTKNHFPRTSYYLCAIGWIPYFMLLSLLALIGIRFIINYAEEIFVYATLGITVISILGLIFSLIIAFIKEKKNK